MTAPDASPLRPRKPRTFTFTIDQRLLTWLGGDDRGESSETIAFVLSGLPAALVTVPRWVGSVPLDVGDFGRCCRLLDRIPEWKDRLPEVAARFSVWAPYVEAWDELSALVGTPGAVTLRLREIRDRRRSR